MKTLKNIIKESVLLESREKAELLNNYFTGKINKNKLQQLATSEFGSSIATKKELDGFLQNKFLQSIMADEYNISKDVLVKKVKELLTVI